MIDVRLYKKGDWEKVKDPIEPFTPICGKGEFDEVAKRGVAVTATDDNNIMACGGVTFMNDKEGTVWVKVSKDCAKRPFLWARAIKDTFRIMTESVGDIKIYTYILKDFCQGEKLARLIKMKKVGESVEHNGNIYNKFMVVV